jgi:hypothetical protein
LEGGRDDAAEDTCGWDRVEQGEAADLAEVVAAYEVLERLEHWPGVGGLEELVPLSEGQDVVAEHAQLRVDDDVAGFLVPAAWAVAELGLVDECHGEMSGDVDPRPENQTEAGGGGAVGFREEGGTRVVDDGGQLDVQPFLLAGRLDYLPQVLSHETVVGEESFAHDTELSSL